MYQIPNDFDWKIYLALNSDLNKNCNEEEVKLHYLNHGIFENRKYKNELPNNFDWKLYIKLHLDLEKISNEEEAKWHYLNYGFFEKRKYKNEFSYNFELNDQLVVLHLSYA